MKTKLFRLLALGDAVGPLACRHLARRLPELKKELSPDLVIVNGENSARGNGVTRESLAALFSAGADAVTTGNHVFQRKEIYDTLDGADLVLRPCNFPGECPGRGDRIAVFSGVRVLILNVMGVVLMQPLASPFETVEKILKDEKGKYDLAVCDFHGEATSEKIGFARAFDGRLSAVFGTHTHVPTADLRILPGGTGAVTDLGMCGAKDSVLGVHPDDALYRLKNHIAPPHTREPEGEVCVNGAVFDLDPETGRCVSLFQILE